MDKVEQLLAAVNLGVSSQEAVDTRYDNTVVLFAERENTVDHLYRRRRVSKEHFWRGVGWKVGMKLSGKLLDGHRFACQAVVMP